MTILDILKKPLEERYELYNASGEEREIQKVIIDGNIFEGYKTFSFFWEITYSENPSRSKNGAIGNINNIPTFITPHLKINYSMLSIDDYRRLYKLILRQREFVVTCYDIVHDKKTTNKMYFAPDQLPTLYTVARKLASGEKFIELTGVKDYTVELIGTNNAMDYVTVLYHSNYPENSGMANISDGEGNLVSGDEIKIGSTSSIPTNAPFGYTFAHWVDESGEIYKNGSYITVYDNLVLYAVWNTQTTYRLNLDYGVSNTKGVDFINVTYNEPIGTLPSGDDNPYVEVGGERYYPYGKGAWHRSNDLLSATITSTNRYWSQKDGTIYWVNEKKDLEITFDRVSTDEMPPMIVKYQDKIILQPLRRSGQGFKGWYLDEQYKKPFVSGSSMPPYDIRLYAKWE